MDKHVIKSLNYIRNWYGYVPTIMDQQRFMQFAARSSTLAAQIHPAKMVITKNNMAYTDGKQIYIPAMYLKAELYDLMEIDHSFTEYAALGCINGSQIHEALHLIHTLEAIDMVAYIKSRHSDEVDRLAKKYGKLFYTAFNIVEDVYIEHRCMIDYPGLYRFVIAKNEIAIGDVSFAETMTTLVDQPTVENTVHFLAHSKNARYTAENVNWGNFAHLVEIIDQVRADNELLIDERLAITVKLMQAMEQEDNTTPEEPAEGEEKSPLDEILKMLAQMMADMEAGEEEDPSAAEASPDNANSVLEQLINGEFTADDVKEFAEALGKAMVMVMDTFEKAKQEEFSEEIGDLQKIIRQGEIKDKVEEVKFIDAPTIDKSSALIETDVNFLKLGTHLRYMRQEKHAPGAPKTSGSKLVKSRIARIATDGKVMAELDSKHVSRGHPQVIILIDASGSMTSNRGTQPGESLFHAVCRAGKGTFESLMRSRVPAAVYAHTTDWSTDGPLVISVASYEMPLLAKVPMTTGNYDDRFQHLRGVRNNENYDGFAIDFVSRRFSPQPGSKVLLVLSDGSPAGDYYRGRDAMDHTATVVKEAAKRGVSTISLSLVESVMEDNDYIYGKDRNLAAFGGTLETTLRKLVQQLSLS